MPSEYELLKKLAKGLNKDSNNKAAKDDNNNSEQGNEKNKYQSIPLRSMESIENDTTHQDKKE